MALNFVDSNYKTVCLVQEVLKIHYHQTLVHQTLYSCITHCTCTVSVAIVKVVQSIIILTTFSLIKRFSPKTAHSLEIALFSRCEYCLAKISHHFCVTKVELLRKACSAWLLIFFHDIKK
jgi:hypothetical protein